MALRRGRTQAGRVYSVLYQYFRDFPVGTVFRKADVSRDLFSLYQQMYPDAQCTDTQITVLWDGVRTLAKYGGPFIAVRNRRGCYRLIRQFDGVKDDAFLRRHYYKIAKKGVKWSRLTEEEKEKIRIRKKQKAASEKPALKEHSTLTKLGDHNTKYKYDSPAAEMLETFVNQYPSQDYIVRYEFKEFTSLCPKTGQPDFATVIVDYVPNKLCIETKSLKLYFMAYRQYGGFMETLINKILEDCVSVCSPRKMRVLGQFRPRGGTYIQVEAAYEAV